MEKFTSKIGNTIELTVDLGEGGTLTNIELELFNAYSFSDGLSESIMTKTPSSLVGGEVTFIFDTDTIITSTGKLYLHFRASKDNMKINDYFQISFKY